MKLLKKGQVHRITNGICYAAHSVARGYARLGPPTGSRPRLAPPTFLLPCKPMVCLFGQQKRHIPRTLCVIGFELVKNI